MKKKNSRRRHDSLRTIISLCAVSMDNLFDDAFVSCDDAIIYIFSLSLTNSYPNLFFRFLDSMTIFFSLLKMR